MDEIDERIEKGDFFYDPDAPEGPSLGAHFWAEAEIIYPELKTPISLRVDNDVLEWFRSQGPGYQTRMNAVLRSFVKAKTRKTG